MDIDDTLVRAAWKRRRYVWSLQEPTQSDTPLDDEPIPVGPSRKRQRPSESSETSEVTMLKADYFPASCEHMFGLLPIPPARHGPGIEHDTFPYNVTFRTADWVNHEIPEDADGYDVVLALSISKWIHLNDGDEGLLRFFRRVHSVLKSGGVFVLEPQEWDTYAKAKRMDAKLKDNAKDLKLRPEDFERILRDIGFGPTQHLGKVGEGGFRRPIDVYVRAN